MGANAISAGFPGLCTKLENAGPVGREKATGFAILFVRAASAQASGLLVFRDGSATLHVQSQRVTATLTDGLARTTVRQTFVSHHGRGGRGLEAVDLFPVPERAALADLALELGGQRLEGLLTERRTARPVFDSIVRRGRDPALLEQIGRSRFHLSVFPVLPDQPTLVELTLALDTSGSMDGK